MNQPTRFGLILPPPGRDNVGQVPQQHNSTSYNYEQYKSAPSASNGLPMDSTPSQTPRLNDYNGEADVPMEDADPYNRSKYPSRPAHQRGSSMQYSVHQVSSAAQRYSPMDMLSPVGTYGSSPKSQSQNSFPYQPQSPTTRQSPTRQAYFQNSATQYQESPSKH